MFRIHTTFFVVFGKDVWRVMFPSKH